MYVNLCTRNHRRESRTNIIFLRISLKRFKQQQKKIIMMKKKNKTKETRCYQISHIIVAV